MKLASKVNDSKELFWSSSYDNESEAQALCADEWFRAIPNTIWGDLFGSDFQSNRQSLYQANTFNTSNRDEAKDAIKDSDHDSRFIKTSKSEKIERCSYQINSNEMGEVKNEEIFPKSKPDNDDMNNSEKNSYKWK